MSVQDFERALDELAARQHGAFNLRQAQSLGGRRDLITRRVATGELRRMAPSVYAVASSPSTWQRALAVALLAREGALVCRRSAAALWHVDGMRHPSRPEIVIPYGGNARLHVATVRRSVYFDLLGRTVIDGFPVTDLAETLFMLAGVVDTRRLGRLVDAALAEGTTDIAALHDVHIRHLGDRIPGVRRFEEVLSHRQEVGVVPPDSELERRLETVLAAAGVPEWSRQHPLPWSTGPYRVDVYVPAWRVIVEADGRRWHTRVEDFERDRERDNAAAAHGIAVLRFTWRKLSKEQASCRRLLEEVGRRRTTDH